MKHLRWIALIWLLLSLWLFLRPTESRHQPLLAWSEIQPALSYDGKILAFEVGEKARKSAKPVAFSKYSHDRREIAILDRNSGEMRFLSRDQASCRQPQLSGDGQSIVFTTMDPRHHLVSVYVAEMETLTPNQIHTPWRAGGHGSQLAPTVASRSDRISFITFKPVGDPSEWRPTVALGRLSEPKAETPYTELPWTEPNGRIALSPDGSRVAWEDRTPAENQVEIRLMTATSSNEPKVLVEGGAEPTLSTNSCVYVSQDSSGVYQLSIYDFETGEHSQLTFGNDDSFEPSLSADGSYLAFTSYASDLVEGDQNDHSDIFLYHLEERQFRLVSFGGDGPSFKPALSGDGSTVAFASRATNLDPDFDQPGQIYLWERGWERCRGVSLSPKS